MANLKQQVVHGVVWAALERFSTQLVGFIVSIVLARLLVPEDYGTIALLSIFLAISESVVGGGFTSALVQKKDATKTDFNSVFYLQLVVSLILYGILFLAAPAIAQFYRTPVLVPVLRVVAITVVFSGINGVQNAELSRGLRFNASFRISIVQSVVSGIVGVGLAFAGFGVWALVWSSVAAAFTGMVTRWLIIAWRPAWVFSWASLSGLFNFGWKMAISSMLDVAYSNLYGLLIGRFYTKTDLAFVNKGNSVPRLAMDSINGTLSRVAFPALSKLQDRRDVLRESMRKIIKTSTFFVFPLMAGCAVCAPSIIRILFGRQWMSAVPYVQVACFQFALWPFHTVNLQAIAAVGRSDIFLVLEIIKKAFGLVILLTSIRHGPFAFVCAVAFVAGPFSVITNTWPNMKLLRYNIWMQLVDVMPTAVIAVIMAVVCWLESLFIAGESLSANFALLFVQVVSGVVVFGVLAVILKLDAARVFLESVNMAVKGKCVQLERSISWLLSRRFGI